jgi:hypothetical protein
MTANPPTGCRAGRPARQYRPLQLSAVPNDLGSFVIVRGALAPRGVRRSDDRQRPVDEETGSHPHPRPDARTGGMVSEDRADAPQVGVEHLLPSDGVELRRGRSAGRACRTGMSWRSARPEKPRPSARPWVEPSNGACERVAPDPSPMSKNLHFAENRRSVIVGRSPTSRLLARRPANARPPP